MGAVQKHTAMKVISAYTLAVLGGKASPSVADVTKVISSMDIEMSDEESKSLEELVEELAGQDINEVMAKGHEILKTVPRGGGGGGGGAAAAGPAASGGDAGAAKKKESSSDDGDAGAPAAGLFDDGGDDY